MDSTTAVCVAVVAAVGATLMSCDGRSNRAPAIISIVVPSTTWQQVKSDGTYDGWFTRHLRCTHHTFLRIADNIILAWDLVHPPLRHNSRFRIDDHVASTIYYLTHSDGFDTTTVVFGISKTRAYEYYKEVILVLQLCFLAEVVHMPRTQADWEEVRMGFEGHGFPNVYGTLDVSLIAVKRFADFTGWHCSKGFTAFNMQVVVDHFSFFFNSTWNRL
ncbi:hypothetical protein AaE_014197 [Aphanomyces astaci]|uniref:DDE Tnp4 domain-containing protein n=1 Tax=Aphanomyces astaci TaxID=112090 RepID=A0A6A4Z8H6_APHAT|nr:hypothetical protein AaE_014197 [Aphanomyces astaci]